MDRIEEIKILLKSNPANASLNAELAKIYEDAGMYEDAIFYYKIAIKYRQDDPEIKYALGTIFFNMEKYGEALDCFNAAAILNQAFVNALIFAGRCHEKLGHARKAVRCYGRAIKASPYAPEIYYTLGNIRMNSGDIKTAISNYSYAIELGPPLPEYYMALGAANEKKGDADEALNNYKFALSVNPEYSQAYKKIAQYYEKRKYTGEALEYYKKAFEIDSSDHILANLIGEMYRDLKKPEEAVIYFKEAISRCPAFQIARDNLDQTYERIIIRGEIDTPSTFNETISRDFYLSALIRIEKSELIDAAIDLVKSLKFNPNNCDSHYRLGILKACFGFVSEALGELSSAAGISPENDEFYFMRGLVRQTTGDMDGAFADYSTAISLKPLGEYYYSRSIVLMIKNDKNAARADLAMVESPVKISAGYVKTLAGIFNANYPITVKNLKKEFYEDGRIMAASFYKGYKKNGFSKLFYETGVVSAARYYENGILSGVSLIFDESGNIEKEAYFEAGMEHGVRRLYGPSGVLSRESVYHFDHVIYERFYDEKGVPLAGVMKNFEKEGLFGDEIYEDGELKGECKYYNLGKNLIAVKNFTNGSHDGKCEYFYESGKLQRTEYYENGKLEKTSKFYFPDGVTCEIEKNYKQGLLNGIARYFDDSGTLLREENYKNDKKEGAAKIYAVENSSHYLKFEVNYSGGRESGTAKKYDPSGVVLKQIFFGNGDHFNDEEWADFLNSQ